MTRRPKVTNPSFFNNSREATVPMALRLPSLHLASRSFGTPFASWFFRKWFAQGCESNRGRNRDEAVPGLFTLVSSLGRNNTVFLNLTGW